MATERETYRYLRLATIVLIVMLAVAVVGQSVAAGCWQTSVSAYYWTSAHGVVLASLCALGACLVVYRGSSDTEDVVLSLSGYLAFVVALVPVPRDARCAGDELPTEGWDVAGGVRNNVVALLVAVALTEVAAYVVGRRSNPPRVLDAAGRVWRGVLWVVLAAVVAVFLLAPGWFDAHAHHAAALTMFAGIVVVVVVNAFAAREEEPSSRFSAAYWVVAVAMVLTLAGELSFRQAAGAAERGVLVLEALLVLEFAAFWAVQTVELWGYPTRTARVEGRRAARAAAVGRPVRGTDDGTPADAPGAALTDRSDERRAPAPHRT